MSATNRAPDYAPHGESGFGPSDALEHAEEGDTVVAEVELKHDAGIPAIRGEVTQVTTVTLEDGRTEKRAITIESEESGLQFLKLRLMTDTKSAHNLVKDDVQVMEVGDDHGRSGVLKDLVTAEVYKQNEEVSA